MTPSPAAVNRPLLSAALMLGGMATLGYTDNYVRVIATEGGLWQFHLFRSLMAAPVLLAAAMVLGFRLVPRRWPPVLVRSFLHATAMMIYFGCLAFLPVAIVAAGLFTAPIFVLLTTRLVFGQRFGPWRLLAVVLGFLGVVLMLGPAAGGVTALAVFPVVAAALYGLGNIATRQWCEGESAATLTAGFFAALAVWGLLGLAVLALWRPEVPPGAEGSVLRGWVAPTSTFLFWTLVQAVGSLFGVALTVRAYQLSEASQVSVFEYSLLAFGAGWGWLLWGEVLSPSAGFGIGLIVASGAVIALRSR